MKRIAIALAATIIAISTTCNAAFPGWDKCMDITLSGYPAARQALTNFPVLVVLEDGSNGVHFTDFELEGADLRFESAEGSTELSYEIETWDDANGKSYVWVRVPAVTNNARITAYWGKEGAAAPDYTTNGTTWSADYAGVWHLAEADGDPVADSTCLNPDGIAANDVVEGAVGAIDGAFDFPGADTASVTIPETSLPSGDVDEDLSIEFWMNRDNVSVTATELMIDQEVRVRVESDAKLWIRNHAGNNGGTDNSVSAGVWYHVVVRWNAGVGWNFMVNGESWRSDNEAVTTTRLQTGNPLLLGADSLDGRLDEVRVSSVLLSDDWIWAEFQTMASNETFTSYAMAQVTDFPSIETSAPTDVTTTSATLNGFLSSTGTSATTVFVYWGETDGTDGATTWANTNQFDVATSLGTVTANVSLASNRDCYYRYAASNASGVIWAETSGYLVSAEISAGVTPATIGESAEAATFSFARPVTATGAALVVAFDVGGDAQRGVDYSGMSMSSVTIDAGETNVTVPVISIPDAYAEGDETAAVTLLAGSYATGTTSQATLTITDVFRDVFNTTTDGGDWHDGSIWSAGYAPIPGQQVVVANDVLVTNSTATLASLTVNSGISLTCSNWTTVLSASNVVINGTVTLPSAFKDGAMSNRVWVTCTNFTLNSGGTILADARGFAGANGPAGGTGVSGAGGTGGGHGGKGGASMTSVDKYPAAVPGTAYGVTNMPVSPGSGGGRGLSATTVGGHGGGAVWIDASGTVTIDGIVSANGGAGLTSSYYSSGGGAGGSIYIQCASFGGSTSGVVRANGGNRGPGSFLGGGGGGGRIAVMYDSLSGSPGVLFSANGGTLSWKTVDDNALYDTAPQPGTLWFSNTALLDSVLAVGNGVASGLNGYPVFGSTSSWTPNLTAVSNATLCVLEHSSLRITNDLTITAGGGIMVGEHASVNFEKNLLLTNSASLIVYGGITNAAYGTSYGTLVGVTNTLTVSPNCWIYPIAHAINGGGALIRVGDLELQAGGGINANKRGYAKQYGPGKGPSGGVNTSGSGAGYGGQGEAAESRPAGGSPYGSTNTPIAPGSGGGDGNNNTRAGGHGGGLVWIEAAGSVIVDGVVTANGGNGTGNSYAAGGGSGGAIFMICNSFSGNAGTLSAHGGNGYPGTYRYGGSGGGGRISVAIGLSAAERADLLAGTEITGLLSYESEPAFNDNGGTLSVTNGTIHTAVPADEPAPGTKQFLKVVSASQRTLQITGDPALYGLPSPNDYGDSWLFEDGTVYTNTVTTPADESDGVRWACTGWRVTDTDSGTPVSNDGTTQVVFTVDADLTLTWLWTNQFQLTVSTGPNGSVNSNLLNGWYTNGISVPGYLATPDPGYYFMSWVGTDVPTGQATNNPLTVTVDRVRTNITAAFASLSGTAKTWNGTGNWWTHGYWSPPGMPGANDAVTLQSGIATMSEAYRIASLVVNDGAALLFTNWTTCLTAGNVTVQSNGVMTLPPAFTTSQMSNRVWVSCANFALDAGGTILADKLGFARSNGPGGGTDSGVNTGGPGGGYGGKGGSAYGYSWLGPAGGPPYGSTNVPVSPGSGGGNGNGYVSPRIGAPGGGAVRIEASGTVTLNGTVTANGGAGESVAGSYPAGGGSGGAVYIDCASFGGSSTGILRANGGRGGTAGGSGGAGGGGGGRIAVWIKVSDPLRAKYLGGSSTSVTRSSDLPEGYSGAVSITNGVGYFNPPDPLGAYPGTAFFFTPPVSATVFLVR